MYFIQDQAAYSRGCLHELIRRSGAVLAAIWFKDRIRFLGPADDKHALHSFENTTTCARCDKLLDFTFARREA